MSSRPQPSGEISLDAPQEVLSEAGHEAVPTDGSVDVNYQYWRDHGGAWADEYARRKTWMVLYHIQEIMLTEYVLRHAEAQDRPLRVLEFGCGVGRHLRNLNRLANVEVHGFDQSAAMVEGCRRWADAEFLRERVTVGEPVGPLPFADGSFDLVYSAEVLVHVRPEHISSTLNELCRISRGHILHIEPSPDFAVDGTVHHGCWNHDLPSLYRKLGRACESLGRGYSAHSAWRTVVGAPPVFRWKPELLELYRSMETDIDRGFSVTDNAKRDAEQKAEIWLSRSKQLEADLKSALECLRVSVSGLQINGEALRTAQHTIADARASELQLSTQLKSALDQAAAESSEAALAAAAMLEAHQAAQEQAEATATQKLEQALAAHASEATGLAARINALEADLRTLASAREHDRTTSALDAQVRAKAWSTAIDRLREEGSAARTELLAAKDRYASFVEHVRAHLGRP